jgi:hypothetical protein
VAETHEHMRETEVRLTCASDKLHSNAAQMAGDGASVVHHDQVQMFSKSNKSQERVWLSN